MRTGTEVWDGLRGIAILTVVLYHTWLFSWYTPALTVLGIALPVATPVRTGYLGVEIFFVISGFVLYLPYARAAAAGAPTPGLREFVERRIRKIAPSYALALLVTTFSALSIGAQPHLATSLLTHVFFVQNSWNDELGAANSVFWSLAIEVQFYLIFPAIAWAFARSPWPTAIAMTLIASAYRTAVARCCLEVEPIARQLPAYLDLFACGMMAAYGLVVLRSRWEAHPRRAPAATAVALAAALGWWLLVANADTQTYVPGGRELWIAGHRTLLGIAIALFGLASSLGARWWRRIVANPALTILGLVSYNLYLWHTLIMIWMWKHDVPHAATAEPHDDPAWKPVFIVTGWLACLAIAAVITYFFERPLLGGATPRPFSFDWRLLGARPGASPERRT